MSSDKSAAGRQQRTLSPWCEERKARAGLCAALQVPHARFNEIVRDHGAAQTWADLKSGPRDSAVSQRARVIDLDLLEQQTHEAGARFVTPGDDEWPEELAELDLVEVGGLGGEPIGLWLKGPAALNRVAGRSIAIVGSRAGTHYGDRVASDLGCDLALASSANLAWTIISGGAYGVDAAAHRGALAAGGVTVAVMACGVDQAYPRGNRNLLTEISTNHLCVSEVPIGANPTKVGFLARNRLIAALSRATVIVEAAARSGAHNTVTWATELGRTVLAVPGPVTSPMSVTPNRLIQRGQAALVSNAAEVRALVEPIGTVDDDHGLGPQRTLDGLDPDVVSVREAIPARIAISVDDLCRATGLNPPIVLGCLAELEELGLAQTDGAGLWRVRHG